MKVESQSIAEGNWQGNLSMSVMLAGSVRILVLHPKAMALDIAYVHREMTRNRMPNDEYDSHTPLFDTITYSNQAVIKKWESALKTLGVPFYDNWETNETYKNILREGIKRKDIHLMVRDKGDDWTYRRAKEDEIQIIDSEGMVDVIPIIRS